MSNVGLMSVVVADAAESEDQGRPDADGGGGPELACRPTLRG